MPSSAAPAVLEIAYGDQRMAARDAAGLDVATENRGDFEALRDGLAELFPGAPGLAVVDAPF